MFVDNADNDSNTNNEEDHDDNMVWVLTLFVTSKVTVTNDNY